MAIPPGTTRFWFTAPTEHIEFLKARFRDMYSDARRPGDVLAFVLAKLVLGEQDPNAYSRVTDRIRIIQDRVGSWEHVYRNALDIEFERLRNFYRRPETDMEFGWKLHVDRAERNLRQAQRAGSFHDTVRALTGQNDPAYDQDVFQAVIDEALQAKTMHGCGRFAAAERLRGFYEGLETLRKDPSIVLATEALDPYRPDAGWAPQTATIPLLERIEAALKDKPGTDLRGLQTPGGGLVHPAALNSAIQYLQRQKLIEELAPGKYEWK